MTSFLYQKKINNIIIHKIQKKKWAREKNEKFNDDIVCPFCSGDKVTGAATMCHLFAQCDFRN